MEISNEAGTHHVLMVAVAIVGKRLDADAATRIKQANYLKILGVHELDQVLHDDVDAVLMEITMIAEAEQIQLQTLALDHAHTRNIVDNDVTEVRLARLGAQRGELGTIERHHIFILGVLVLEGLEHVGAIVKLILRALVAQQRHTL